MANRIGLVLIQEEDGSPSTVATRLKVSNDSLTDNGDGTVSISTGGAGAATIKATYFATISSGTTSGTITKPAGTNATLIMDEWGTDTDAILSTMENGKPTFESPRDASGNIITTTFDTSGNYTFSGTPSPAADHALIYVYTAPLSDFLSSESLFETEVDNITPSQDVEWTGDHTFEGSVVTGTTQSKQKNNYDLETTALLLTSDYHGRPVDYYHASDGTITIDTLAEANDGAEITVTRMGAGYPTIVLPASVTWPDGSTDNIKIMSKGIPFKLRYNHARLMMVVDTNAEIQ